ncbi:hypothetical protein BMS3Bbin06_01923 [bacterium BMS3Bbin06]|nr:hypothetical protein BMS3Abin08_00664 [bacterium BMS3Abin08]GBE35383.1 hypothetical protein BMS3Bbin06_01923 [bacterium BMS3Bbin06]HDO36251.1 hypothetical protein [Nitrospirota bacterium]HDY71337.1 hypothetical protein [Nitrospirota bacterium]
MKVKYLGETRNFQTVKGGEKKIDNGMELECMEKEYQSQAVVRVVLDTGEHVKIKRSELQRV